MTRTYTNTFAAIAAVFLTLTSFSTIVTVPPAHAQASQDVVQMIELA